MSIDPFISKFAKDLFPAPSSGPLSGLRLAVKDNFDIAGQVTGAGHPLWAQTHPPAQTTAPLVLRLMELGAHPVGRAHMDELAYSLMGENAHYGTPFNPRAPGSVPGGSSSGSASAVAQDLADIGLGSDTGGSVRLPASFCGLWGWRPSHGLLDGAGMTPLAPSYDVPGFLTRDGALMELLARHLAPAYAPALTRFLAPSDLWALADEEGRAALGRFVPDTAETAPLMGAESIAGLQPAFRVMQGAEVAHHLGPWLRAHDPSFGPGVKDRFAGALALREEEIAQARTARAGYRAQLRAALGLDGVLVLPTVPAAAPALATDPAEMDRYRTAAIKLLSLAGHAGLPQISLPLAQDNKGAPVGLSLIGPEGSDQALIALATSLAAPFLHNEAARQNA